jgi:hypothetical protein
MRCTVLDGQFWGMGILAPIKKLQEELNSHENLMLKNADLNINNIWAYDESIGLPDSFDNMEAGQAYPVPFYSDKPLLVPLMQGRPLPPEAYKIREQIDSTIQTTIGQPGYRQQLNSGTATEAQLETAMVESRNRLQALMGELTYATEVARFFHSRRQQYLKDEGQTFRVLGAKGVSYPTMTPNDIAGEFDFVMAGQHMHASRDVLRQQLLQAIALIKGDPALMSISDMPEIWQEFWKMCDFVRPERFYSPPPQRTWDPKTENIVLMAGEWVEVEPNDDHEEHMQVHQQAFANAISEGQEAQEQLQKHIDMHNRFMKQTAQQAPPQEEPGVSGDPGATPNLENAVPSQGGLTAAVGGAGAQR